MVMCRHAAEMLGCEFRLVMSHVVIFFFFQAEDGIRDGRVTGVQTCALPIYRGEGQERRVEVTFDLLLADEQGRRGDGEVRRALDGAGEVAGGELGDVDDRRRDRKSVV